MKIINPQYYEIITDGDVKKLKIAEYIIQPNFNICDEYMITFKEGFYILTIRNLIDKYIKQVILKGNQQIGIVLYEGNYFDKKIIYSYINENWEDLSIYEIARKFFVYSKSKLRT